MQDRQWRAGVLGGHLPQVAGEQRAFERLCADEVEVEREYVRRERGLVRGDRLLQPRQGARTGVAGDEQVQDRHVMRLAGAERAVHERAAVAAGRQRRRERVQSIIEGAGELVGDDVLGHRRRGVLDAGVELEYEVGRADVLGD